MKSFIVATILFLLLLTLIVINSIYINKACDLLSEMSKELGEIGNGDFDSRLSTLESSWQEFRKVARISCPDSELDKIDLTLTEMRSHYESNNQEGLEVAKARLCLLLRELSRLERISFD